MIVRLGRWRGLGEMGGCVSVFEEALFLRCMRFGGYIFLFLRPRRILRSRCDVALFRVGWDFL